MFIKQLNIKRHYVIKHGTFIYLKNLKDKFVKTI